MIFADKHPNFTSSTYLLCLKGPSPSNVKLCEGSHTQYTDHTKLEHSADGPQLTYHSKDRGCNVLDIV